MNHKKDKRILILSSLLLVIGLLISLSARLIPSFADFFSSTVYRVTSGCFARIFSIFPFSVSELLLYCLIAGILIVIILSLYRIISRKSGLISVVKALLIRFYFVACLLFFLYAVNCGVNYYRTGFAEATGLEAGSYTGEELLEYCTWLVGEINRTAPLTDRDLNGLAAFGSGESSACRQAMQDISSGYPVLDGYYPSAKPVLVSQILSYQHLTGIYSPFTVEANYNKDMPGFYKAFTICHELSHLKGFMQEEEASFIGYLACTRSDNPNLVYSGCLVAYIYASNELWNYDQVSCSALRSRLCTAADEDLKANNRFWDSFEGAISKASSKLNDTYLKANSQNSGVKSYDKVTSLMLADYLNQYK